MTDNNANNANNAKSNPPNPPVGKSFSPLKSYPYPEWLNKNLWADFYRMRSRIKKPITTERTIEGRMNDLKALIDQGYDQDEIIQAAIDGCWLTFYPPKKRTDDDDREWVV